MSEVILTQNKIHGRIPEWPKGTDCKSAANCFDGSNPSPSICRSGGTGRRPGLKIPWVVIPVPVRSRFAARLRALILTNRSSFSIFSQTSERILLRQDSPPAAGRKSDIIPFRRSAILPGGLFSFTGKFKEVSCKLKKEQKKGVLSKGLLFLLFSTSACASCRTGRAAARRFSLFKPMQHHS